MNQMLQPQADRKDNVPIPQFHICAEELTEQQIEQCILHLKAIRKILLEAHGPQTQ